MAAKTTTTSGFSFLTRIPKLLAPFLLFAVMGILMPAVRRVYVNPLVAEMSRHLNKMEKHTDPLSAEYARLLQETQQDATSVLIISIAEALLTLTIAASSATTTYSGGARYSLGEFLREVTKWRNLKIPVIATAAIVTMSQLLSVALLGASFPTTMHDLGLLSVQGSVVLVASMALFNLGVMALINFAVRRKDDKEWSVVVLATLLLPTLLIPVCAFGLLHLCTKQVMGLGVSLLSVYDLVQILQGQLYLAAACVYCYCYQSKATKENKEMVVAKSRYFTYAILFVLHVIMYAPIYYITSKMLVK